MRSKGVVSTPVQLSCYNLKKERGFTVAYAILRTAKLKTFGNIAASASHNFRERETLNADPERTHLNIHNGANSSDEVTAKVKSLLPEKFRSDAVLCIEYLITASPEFFENGEQNLDYFERARDWLVNKHGEKNIVYSGIQLDEKTPHMVAYVVPIDAKGKLNAKHFLGGREILRNMQTDFAKEVGQKFGLERGIEGSKMEHENIQAHYTKLKQAEQKAKDMVNNRPEWTLSERMDMARGKSSPKLDDFLNKFAVLAIDREAIENSYAEKTKKLTESQKEARQIIESKEKELSQRENALEAREREIGSREREVLAEAKKFNPEAYKAREEGLKRELAWQTNRIDDLRNQVAEANRKYESLLEVNHPPQEKENERDNDQSLDMGW